MIDSAHLYSSGDSERTIGAALAPFDDELVVATKGGYHGAQPDRLRAEMKESLERLRTDSIELYYLHRVDPEVALPRSLEVLAEYREAGTIRHVGVSEVSRRGAPARPEPGAGRRGPERVQPRSAKARRGARLLRRRGHPLRARSSPCGAAGGRSMRSRRGLARPASRSSSRGCCAAREMMLPIPGTLSLEHLEQNLAALDLELSDEDFAARSKLP